MYKYVVSFILIFFLLTTSGLYYKKAAIKKEEEVSSTYTQIRDSYYKSYASEHKQNYDKAIKDLQGVYQTYPKSYTVNLRLGWLYYLKGNYANSEWHYKKASETAPDSIEALLGLTYPLLAKEDYEAVESICYRILKKDYYNYYGSLKLVYALRKQGKTEQALAVAKRVLTHYPADVSFLTAMAECYYENGEKEKANTYFSNILILDPDNAAAMKYLGIR